MISRPDSRHGSAGTVQAREAPLIPGGIETDVKMITPTTYCIAQDHRFPLSFAVDQICLCHVVPSTLPSECFEMGVRGPAAVDYKCVDRFVNALEHVRTQRIVYKMTAGLSIGNDGVDFVNVLRTFDPDLLAMHKPEFGKLGHAVHACAHLQS